MQGGNNMTPISGTPFSVGPANDFFVRDEGEHAYDLVGFPVTVEGHQGRFDIEVREGQVRLTVRFGTEQWGVAVGDGPVIDGTRYSVAVSTRDVPLAEFDLAAAADAQDLRFRMWNMDRRDTVIGMSVPLELTDENPLLPATRERFVRGVSAFIEDMASRYPSFSDGFRSAVLDMSIARLRAVQRAEWMAMAERHRRILDLMSQYPATARPGGIPETPRMTDFEGIGFAEADGHLTAGGVVALQLSPDGTLDIRTLDGKGRLHRPAP